MHSSFTIIKHSWHFGRKYFGIWSEVYFLLLVLKKMCFNSTKSEMKALMEVFSFLERGKWTEIKTDRFQERAYVGLGPSFIFPFTCKNTSYPKSYYLFCHIFSHINLFDVKLVFGKYKKTNWFWYLTIPIILEMIMSKRKMAETISNQNCLFLNLRQNNILITYLMKYYNK